jgi:hypothetical protein
MKSTGMSNTPAACEKHPKVRISHALDPTLSRDTDRTCINPWGHLVTSEISVGSLSAAID